MQAGRTSPLVLLVTVVLATRSIPGLAQGPAPAVTCGDECQSAQRRSLLELYGDTNGPSWYVSDFGMRGTEWGSGDESSSGMPAHCSWAYVFCCGTDGYIYLSPVLQYQLTKLDLLCDVPYGVTMLVLSNNNLQGTLPQQASFWAPFSPSLLYLDMSVNSMHGPLPEGLTAMTNTRAVRMSTNNFVGTIPATWFNMSAINILNLNANKLTGTLSSMAFMPELVSFMVGHNGLIGTIPEDWSTSPRLQIFSVEYNALLAPLLDRSKLLSIRSAAVQGTLPAPLARPVTVAAGTSLQLQLSANGLSGSLPVGLRFLPLTHLAVSHNAFSGDIIFTQNLPDCFEFRLDNNRFSGPLPAVHGAQVYTVNNNLLTGTIPVLNSATLREFDFSHNSFVGELPGNIALPNCNTFNCNASGLITTTQNSRNEFLPEYLGFNMESGGQTQPQIPYLLCQPIVAIGTSAFAVISSFYVDPSFYQFQHCGCASNYDLIRSSEGGVLSVTCIRSTTIPWALIVLPTLFGTFILLVVAASAYFWFRMRYSTSNAYKLKGPPAEGKPVTLVCTDIEGSTELWEWDSACMDEAQNLHDRLMRSQLTKFCGYEVATEGDAFTIAFHDPLDAVAWAITMQHLLLAEKWPAQLDRHEHSCIRLRDMHDMLGFANHRAASHAGQGRVLTLEASEDGGTADPFQTDLAQDWLSLDQVNRADILFHGVSVRMAIATGIARNVQVNKVSKRTEYRGELLDMVRAIVEVPCGGQILLDGASFAGISSSLVELHKMVSAQVETAQPRNDSSLSSTGVIPARLHTNRTRTRESRENDFVHAVLDHEEPSRADLHSNSIELTRSGHSSLANTSTFLLDRKVELLGATTRSSLELPPSPSIKRYEHFDLLPPQHTEFAPVTELTWQKRIWRWPFRIRDLSFRANSSQWAAQRAPADFHGVRPHAQGASVMVIDQGQHVLPKLPGSHVLVQIGIPGLEERARCVSPSAATALVLSPGYFLAPAAAFCPLDRRLQNVLLPDVTMVFCAIEAVSRMKEKDPLAAGLALGLYRHHVRQVLTSQHGYECQEAEGEFMLAFATPLSAVQFCLQVQDAMMANSWDANILQLPTCQLESDGDVILWNGPRVRMGICEGQPASVAPHTTSGRADYFGPLVNRAARFCFAAARGGQITMPLHFAQKIVQEWTGQELLQPEQQQQQHTPQVLTQLPRGRMSAEPGDGRALSDLPYIRRKTSSIAQVMQGRARKKPMVRLSWDEGPDSAPATSNPLFLGSSDLETAPRGMRPSFGALRLVSQRFIGRPPVQPAAEQDLPSARATVDDPGAQPQLAYPHRGRSSMDPAESAGLPSIAGGTSHGMLPRMISVAIDTSRQLSQEQEHSAHHASLLHNAEQQLSAEPGSLISCEDEPCGQPSAAGISRTVTLQQLTGPSQSHMLADEPSFGAPLAANGSFSPNRSRRPSSKDNLQPGGLSAFDIDKEVELHHCGVYLFKGLTEPSTIVQINRRKWMRRKFPALQISNKAKLVGQKQGLLCVIQLLQ